MDSVVKSVMNIEAGKCVNDRSAPAKMKVNTFSLNFANTKL